MGEKIKNIIRLKMASIAIFAILSLAYPHMVYAAKETEVRWLGHSAFEITTPQGHVLLIDPWLNNPKAPEGGFEIEKADLVLVTHAHFDHFGDTADIIKKTGAELCTIYEIGMAAIADKGVPEEKATFKTLMNIGGKISVFEGEVEISMVQAMHSSGIVNKTKIKNNDEDSEKEKSEILYGGTSVGFVIRIKEGPTIYHTGDTGLFGDMRLIRHIYHPNLMLVPIGDHFTMGPELAAYAVKMINPRWVIPMHYATFPVLTGTPEKFNDELLKLNIKAEVIVLKPGESDKF